MIDEKAVVACYVDAAAILAMLVLLLQSGHLRRQNNLPMRVYNVLSWQVLFNAVACFVFNAMYRQTAPWCHTVAWISRTLCGKSTRRLTATGIRMSLKPIRKIPIPGWRKP